MKVRLCAILVSLWVIAGCAAPPEPVIQVRTVNVAVPVPCREKVPARPDMPTEALSAEPTLDAFVQAITAEVELREGYEGQLRTALEACTSNAGPVSGIGLKPPPIRSD